MIHQALTSHASQTSHHFCAECKVAATPGSFAVTLVDGQIVTCRPAFQLLSDLAAGYTPERSEALTWVPASDVRQAARLFAMEKPSCYSSWVGLEQHASAMQTNRAVCVFYTLTGQFDQRGINVVFAGVPIQPITGTELLPAQQVARRLGLGEHTLTPGITPPRWAPMARGTVLRDD